MLEGLATSLMAGLRATSPPEALAVVLGILYVVLVVRRNRWCWVAGGLSSAILAWLAAQHRLPMQAGLQVWYVIMAGYGWWHWSRSEAGRIQVRTLRYHALGIVACLVMSALIARWLSAETQAAWPYLDSATTLLSLLATWLVARVVLENWLYWIAIDAVSAYLFAVQGLVFTAVLFSIYLFIAVAGFMTWTRQYQLQEAR